MEAQIVENRVKRLHPSQSVKITFARDGIAAVHDLVSMNTRGMIKINKSDHTVALATLQEWNWGHDRNRTMFMYFLSVSCAEEFGREIGPYLEQMEICDDRIAKPIMTGKQPKQTVEAQKIIDACLSADLMNEAHVWNMEITGKLDVTKPGLPSIVFEITYSALHTGSVTVATVVLDGWSGRIFLNDKGEEEAVTHPVSVTFFLKKQIDAYIAQATAI